MEKAGTLSSGIDTEDIGNSPTTMRGQAKVGGLLVLRRFALAMKTKVLATSPKVSCEHSIAAGYVALASLSGQRSVGPCHDSLSNRKNP